jgi:hypothetical protein
MDARAYSTMVQKMMAYTATLIPVWEIRLMTATQRLNMYSS